MDYPSRFPNGIEAGEIIATGNVSNAKAAFNTTGGFMIKLTNKTGAASVKGTIVDGGTSVNNSFTLCVKDIPDVFGVVYEAGIADGAECWVTISGIAEVLFVGSTTRGQFARGFLTADGGSYIAGYALAENVPTSPFSTDKHFYELGHILESRTGAGLAKCVLHFN